MTRLIFVIARYTLLEALRNRLLWLALTISFIAFGLSAFLGDVAITEHTQIQIAVLAAMLRISGVVMLALIVVTTVLREMQDKSLELLLAMDVPRASYYFGKLAGFAVISFLLALLFSTLLLMYAEPYAVLWWGVSFCCELLLVTCLGLVMLFTFKQIPAAISAVFLFYVAARSMSAVQLMAENPIVRSTDISQQFINGFVEMLSWLLPSLHQFTRSEWLLYGANNVSELMMVLGQTLVYGMLLSMVALFDFYRKNFV
ncbi:MAG: ABC transporter permease [Gammaproteobacteria bacterium]|nr:ABC transporter permease [Gammaproteobacteria bacterium]